MKSLFRAIALLSQFPLIFFGQAACPTPNFLTARTVNLKPTSDTHVDVIRQADGFYAAFTVTDTAPYRVIATTPHFERQLAACLPHALPASPLAAAAPASAATSYQVSFATGSNLFLAHIGPGTIFFDLFDSQHNLISEKPFTSVVTVPGSASPGNDSFESLALADLNNDGKADLVAVFNTPFVGIGNYGGVWTFLGNGDGTFQPGVRQVFTSRSFVSAATNAAIADLNGDGKADLFLTAPNNPLMPATGAPGVFLGNGDGTFRTDAIPYPANPNCSYPQSAAFADLNRDNKTDLVYLCGNGNGGIAIALGNGDGTFQTPTLYPALPGYTTDSVAVGDLNGDGIPDIASSTGSILFGDGKGGVASRADYAINLTATNNGAVMISDFDGDGVPDLIYGTGVPTYLSGVNSLPGLTVLFGAGHGAFVGAPVSFPLPGSAYDFLSGPPPLTTAIVSADFTNDGIPDAAQLSFTQLSGNGSIQITFLRGNGSGGFGPPATQVFPHSGVFLLRGTVAGDFDHDGKQDLAVLLSTESAGELDIYPGNGDGTFSAPSITPLNLANPESLLAADLNRDGIPDLVVAFETAVQVFLGRAGGAPAGPTYSLTAANPAVAIADFNSDGIPDLAVASAASSTLAVYSGNGDGTFRPATSAALFSPASGFAGNLTAADFNGGGHADLAVALGSSPGSQVEILTGSGSGAFTALTPLLSPLANLAATDFNGDGIPDLIGLIPAAPNNAGAAYSPLSIRLGNGDGTFATDDVVIANESVYILADLNRDGLPDILAGDSDGIVSLLNLLTAQAGLTVVSAASYSSALAPGAIASAFGLGLPNGAITVTDSAGVMRNASVLYQSSAQDNFVIPLATAPGAATVGLSGPGALRTAQIEIVPIAPGLFTVGGGIAAAYAVRVSPSGAQTALPVFTTQAGNITAAALDLSQPGDVYLTLFGTGFAAATAALTGVKVQGLALQTAYAGPQGSSPGLDQINVLLPAALAGAGVATIVASANGIDSNAASILIK